MSRRGKSSSSRLPMLSIMESAVSSRRSPGSCKAARTGQVPQSLALWA